MSPGESNLRFEGLVRRATQGGLSCAKATRLTSQRRQARGRSLFNFPPSDPA